MSAVVSRLRPPRDGASVEEVLRREAQGLLAYFRRRVRPEEDAGDLLAETMLVAWRRAKDLPADPEGARMWLYGVARRVLATHRRGQGRRVALAAAVRHHLAVEDATAGLDGRAAPDPRAEGLAELVRALPDADREIVMLVHWEGFALLEVAQLLGMPAGTVRSRYARLRARLRESLEA